jgi:flavodoxin I
MNKTAIFFGPEKGAVNRVADMIRSLIGPEKVDLVPVKNASANDFVNYDQIIFGISTVGKETWDGKPSSSDWGKFMPQISQGDFKGKTVAIYGLGDHITYASSFVDFMGLLASHLMKTEARIVGQVPVDEYEFDESAAIFDGNFIGLPLDEDFEPELTPERVKKWIIQLGKDFVF